MQSVEELTARRESLISAHTRLMDVVASVQASQDFRDAQHAKRIQDELLYMAANAAEYRARAKRDKITLITLALIALAVLVALVAR